ncbi:hypothetical protein H6G97_06905 [Nostoc flagelliforme FACHB-838]|uniref:DUF29 domain-containing protein n=1 Tax=Nostoc flagelliforme FACHB-838 TaxID=2692904 RepID=A0ABR8DIV5_9NOSO|nr:hypothetical protein [Nostoc flagelliforme]MBD2529315.1 hypothetical protein [Nostoc flagelliforme FACHB-838]
MQTLYEQEFYAWVEQTAELIAAGHVIAAPKDDQLKLYLTQHLIYCGLIGLVIIWPFLIVSLQLQQ